MTRRFRLLLPGTLVLIAACATLRSAIRFEPPTFVLQEVHITGLSLAGGAFDLVFDLYNPNAYDLRSTRLEVGLDLEGVHFGDALIERAETFPGERHSRLVVPVQFQWTGVAAGAGALVSRQAVAYRFAGSVTVATPLGDKQVGLHGDGSVPLTSLVR